jgi:hypothetical protein
MECDGDGGGDQKKRTTKFNFLFYYFSPLCSIVASLLLLLSIRAPIDEGTEQIVVLQDKTVTSDGLAVDWIYNHIYFTDTKRYTIEIMNFDGNMGKVLIKDNLEIPRAIALNPVDGWMFWTDWGSSPRIERAGMDGTHRQTIVSYDVKWPNGLTLDIVQKRVYWVN